MMLHALRPLRSVRHFASVATSSAQTSASSAHRLSPLALKAAEEVSSQWRGTSATGGKTKNYIGGEFVESQTDKWLEVRDPVSDLRLPRFMSNTI